MRREVPDQEEHEIELNALMQELPELNDMGLHRRHDWNDEEFRRQRQALADYSESVWLARLWIREFLEPTQQINRKTPSSYQLKHYCEKVVGYVSNGELIAAMILEGFRYTGDFSPRFNVSKRSCKEAWKVSDEARKDRDGWQRCEVHSILFGKFVERMSGNFTLFKQSL